LTSIKEFEGLPDDSKLWVFSLAQEIPVGVTGALATELQEFIDGWRAHGSPVRGALAFPDRWFVLVAADPSFSEVSGCSIDSLFRSVETICRKFDLQVTDPAVIYFRENSRVTALGRDEFETACRSGRILETTPVFNNAVSTLAELRAGRWEQPFARSWHAARFQLSN